MDTATAPARRGRKPKAAAEVNGVNLALLASIVLATQGQPGFAYVSTAESDPLANYTPPGGTAPTPLVERNPAAVDPSDATKIGTRATAEGIAFSTANPAPAPKESKPREPAGPKPTFEMESVNSVPIAKRGSAETIYPFETMAAPNLSDPANPQYAAFFVKPSEKMPNPAKALASTVSSATRRYTHEVKDAAGNVVKDSAGKVQKTSDRRYVVRAEARWFDANGARVQPGTAGATEVKGALVIREK